MSVEKHRHFLSFYSLYSESFKSFKGTVSVILSDAIPKDINDRFNTVPLPSLHGWSLEITLTEHLVL